MAAVPLPPGTLQHERSGSLPMGDWNPLKERIGQMARKAGFDLFGVAPAGHFAELEYFPHWIADGRHGEMSYLASRTEDQRLKRESLANVAPWARSVVVCAIRYNSALPFSTECNEPERGWISRYAWSEIDYHETVLTRLRALESSVAVLAAHEKLAEETPLRTWCYVDTGPVVERVLARYSGIGWQGKNTCIINQEIGSWIFLGVLLTSLPLPPDLPAPDRCGSCTRCLDACPTGALPRPYQMDATRCIAYLTIEKRGSIPSDLRAGIGRNIFGCDICQDVCPWNQHKLGADGNAGDRARRRDSPSSAAGVEACIGPDGVEDRAADVSALPTAEITPRTQLVNPELRWLLHLTEEEFRAVFRHSPVKRAKYQGLMRNVIVVIGNSGDASFIPELQTLLADCDDPLLREHVQWSLVRLRAGKDPAK